MTEEAKEEEEEKWQKWVDITRGNVTGRKMRESAWDRKKDFSQFFSGFNHLRSSLPFASILPTVL